MSQIKTRCPSCQSEDVVKDGTYEKQRIIQRYMCNACGNRFSIDQRRFNALMTKHKIVEHILEHDFKRVTQIAETLQTSAVTIDKYLIELGQIQAGRFDSKSIGSKSTLSFHVSKVKEDLIVELTMSEKDFVTDIAVVNAETELICPLKEFFDTNGFNNKIELSNKLSTAFIRICAFIFVWNYSQSKQQNLWLWN